MASLADLLDAAAVARLAGSRSLGRGTAYAEGGAVGRLEIAEERIAGTVQGTEPYRVRIGVEGERLAFACSCPVGVEGAFCKHCVAVALCWLDEGAPGGPTLEEVRAHLRTLDLERLVELLVEHARDDERLAERLRMLTLRAADGPLDVGAYRSMLDRAITVHGFVSYQEAWGYFSGIDEALDALEALLGDGHSSAVVSLAEHALGALESAIEGVDDSGGGMSDVIDRLEDLHHAACLAARPDPVELAERLLEWELRSDWDLFDRAAARYADALGATGLERYRALAEERWASVPALGPGESSGERFAITRIMETLAELSGDVEQLVAVRSRDLSHGHDFLRIAELYREKGDPDAGLEWAERGLRAFPDRPDARLRSFVADEYRRRGRHGEALELSWLAFRDRPSLDTYRQLKPDAEPLGEWAERREAALQLLRERTAPAAKAPRSRPPAWAPGRDRSELVRIFLWEGGEQAAWETATEGGCSDALWLELATRRRRTKPEDALRVYERQVEAAIAGRSNDAYREAVALMEEVRSVLEQMGDWDAFPRYVERVREAHRRKRNLVKLLDAIA